MTTRTKRQVDRVHPDLRPQLQGMDAVVPFTRATLDAVRAQSAARHLLRPVHGRTRPEERVIDTTDGPLTMFVFNASPGTAPKPCLVWFHGGGFVMGKARDMWQGPLFAERAGCVVVSVEYRLAPEQPFPAAVLDAQDALAWVHREAGSLGIDPDRIAVGGASAGGGLAAGLCHVNLRGDGLPIRFQLLLYPMLDNLHDTPSGRIPDHPVWNREMSLAAWEMYLDGTAGANAPCAASPARATSLAGLPPAFISVGEVDLFHDECLRYAQRLRDDGVRCVARSYPGMIHGGEMAGRNTAIGAAMIDDYVAALIDGLGGQSGSESTP